MQEYISPKGLTKFQVEYLNYEEKSKTQNSVSSSLRKFNKCYKNINKKPLNEIHELNENEFVNTLKEVLSSDCSKNLIYNYSHEIRLYLDWIVKKKKCKISFDYETNITKVRDNAIKEQEEEFFGRDEIYDFAYNTQNVENGIIAALIFEGIGNMSKPRNSIITTIKYQHFKENKLLVNNLEIEMPEEIKYLFEKNYNENTVLDTETGLTLNKNEYVIKGGTSNKKAGRRKGTENYNDIYIPMRIKTKDENNNRIFFYNNKIINGDSLIKAGKMFYLSLIEQIQNSIEKEDYYAVLEKYGQCYASDSTYNKIVNEYKEYKKMGYYKKIEIEKYYKIYKQIKEVSEQQSLIFVKADKELGCLGEKYFHKYLINEYGKNIVFDETMNGVGYDFSVKLPNKKIMYEVKSTKMDSKVNMQFNLTIKELINAIKGKENYNIVIIFFKELQPVNTYLISNPISQLNLDKQANILAQLESEGICVPQNIRVNIKFDCIKKYKKNLKLQEIIID